MLNSETPFVFGSVDIASKKIRGWTVIQTYIVIKFLIT